jgi:microcystin degradation protein MlrC
MTRPCTSLGPEAANAIGLDLHRHVSDAPVAACEVVIIRKENPHLDVMEAGKCAARLALAMLAGCIRPQTTIIKPPILLSGGRETLGPSEASGKAGDAVGCHIDRP